jgi:hypothetical protein
MERWGEKGRGRASQWTGLGCKKRTDDGDGRGRGWRRDLMRWGFERKGGETEMTKWTGFPGHGERLALGVDGRVGWEEREGARWRADGTYTDT